MLTFASESSWAALADKAATGRVVNSPGLEPFKVLVSCLIRRALWLPLDQAAEPSRNRKEAFLRVGAITRQEQLQ